MTARQLEVLHAVHTTRGWYRARSNGERVTLASLWRAGVLDRRAWRGAGVSAAHEYRVARAVILATRHDKEQKEEP